MKRLYYLLSVALVALALTGCNMFGPTTEYTATDLQGKWTESDNPLCYWVYSLTKDDTGEYYWGKTWDESDEVYESDLVEHGNGWFKWSLSSNTLTQLHVLEISSALVPKTYTVSSCNSSTLVLKDTYGKTISYKKVQ